MITRPLDLQARLSPPPRDLDVFAWLNVGVIVLFFGLLGSKFILAPGLPIGVEQGNTVELPEVSAAGNGAGIASVVVSYRRDNVILFEGGMYSLVELRKPMKAYLEKHPESVMLVRADRQVSAQALIELCVAAKQLGFARVLLAAEQSPSGPGGSN